MPFPPSAGRAACLAALGLVAAGAALTRPASAGAPFVTDDPDTPEHFEINLAVSGTHVAGQTTGFAPSLEVNYAAAENVQLHVQLALGFSHVSGDRTRWGIGDAEFGVKYRFLDAKEDDWFPSAAVYPIVFAPTGDEDRGLETGHTRAFLPLWLGKEFGDWTAFGGGGYNINPGSGNRNSLFLGVGITRKVTEDLSLGAEVFRTSKTEDDGKDAIGFNLGGIYDISDRHHILISAGRGLRNASETNEFSTYIAYQLTF
jgi:hypothetical protein